MEYGVYGVQGSLSRFLGRTLQFHRKGMQSASQRHDLRRLAGVFLWAADK